MGLARQSAHSRGGLQTRASDVRAMSGQLLQLWSDNNLHGDARLALTALEYVYVNHRDQRVIFNFKSS